MIAASVLLPGPVEPPDLVVLYLEGTDRRLADTDAMFRFGPALSRRIWDGAPSIASDRTSA